MQKWEYRRLHIQDAEYEDCIEHGLIDDKVIFVKEDKASQTHLRKLLNAFGEEGWEMTGYATKFRTEIFYFKRPIE